MVHTKFVFDCLNIHTRHDNSLPRVVERRIFSVAWHMYTAAVCKMWLCVLECLPVICGWWWLLISPSQQPGAAGQHSSGCRGYIPCQGQNRCMACVACVHGSCDRYVCFECYAVLGLCLQSLIHSSPTRNHRNMHPIIHD